MFRLGYLVRLTLVSVLIPVATSTFAGGWAFGKSDTALPVSGNTMGEVVFIYYDPVLTEDPCPNSPPVDPTGIKAQSTTQTVGWLSALGWVGLDSTHCFNIDLTIPAFVAEDGMVEIFDRKGDTITGTYESVQLSPPFAWPPAPPVQDELIVQEGIIEVVEGTGRFQGASGKLVFRVYVRVDLESNWGIRWVISGLVDLTE